MEKLASPQVIFVAIVSFIGLASVGTLAVFKPKVEKPKAEKSIVVEKPVMIRTIPIIPQPKPDFQRVASASTVELTPKPTPTVEPPVSAEVGEPHSPHRHWRVAHNNTDICAAHRMHKIITNHGKSWRCR